MKDCANTNYVDRLHGEIIPDRYLWRKAIAAVKSRALYEERGTRRRAKASKIPIHSMGAAIHITNDKTPNINPCQSPWETNEQCQSHELAGCVDVFVLKEKRRDHFAKKGRPGGPNIHGRIIRKRRSKITIRGPEDTREPTHRLIQSPAGCSFNFDHQSRVYCGLRGSEGCGMPEQNRNNDDSNTIHGQRGSEGCGMPEQNRNNDDPNTIHGQRGSEGCGMPEQNRNYDDPNTIHGQRGSIWAEPDAQIRTTQPASQTPVSLHPPAEPSGQAEDCYDRREGQPSRYPDKVATDEYNEWMEGIMDEYLRRFPEIVGPQPTTIDLLIPDMTEDQLWEAGMPTWTVE